MASSAKFFAHSAASFLQHDRANRIFALSSGNFLGFPNMYSVHCIRNPSTSVPVKSSGFFIKLLPLSSDMTGASLSVSLIRGATGVVGSSSLSSSRLPSLLGPGFLGK